MNNLDKHLEEIQLQEVGPVLIGMGLLAAVLAAGAISDKINKKRAEAILTKHKPMVDKIVATHMNKILSKSLQLGKSLRSALVGKYGDVIKYWNKWAYDGVVNDLANKNKHEQAIKSTIKKILMAYVNKNGKLPTDKTYIHFFADGIGIRPADDDSYENAWFSKDDLFKKDKYPDEDTNPLFKKWDKRYDEAINLINKADQAIYPLFVKVTTEILTSLAKAIKGEISK